MATIENHSNNTVVGGTSGDDSITNYGNNVTISCGNGYDSVYNCWGDHVVIFGGAGDDSLKSWSVYTTISGGTGDDTIEAHDWKTTVSGGAENDVIIFSNYQSNDAVVVYTNGDGDDTVYAFDGYNDTLRIASDSYTTNKSGNDLIVYVGDGSITLKDNYTANIVTVSGGDDDSGDDDGGDDETNAWKISGTTATYGTSKKTLVTVKGVKSLSGLSLKNKVVTVANSSLESVYTR